MRKASLLLSGLVLTPDSALEAFRKRRAADPTLDDVHLRRARDLLDAIADALTSTDGDKWKGIEQAWNAIQGDGPAVGAPAPAAGPAAPAPSAPAAPSAPSAPAGPMPAAPSETPATAAANRGSAPSSPAASAEPAADDRGPAPPPPVGAPLTEDQIPAGIANPQPSPSPWAKVTPQPVVAAPPPPQRMPEPSASPASADALGIDVDALNAIKLDSDDAGTLPADAVFATRKALPFEGGAKPPPDQVSHAERDPLGETRTAFHELDFVNQPLPFDGDAPDSRGSFEPTERLDLSAQSAQLPQHLAHMTLEQYAALCAECAVSPQWTQQIHARYGIRSSDDRQALDQHWQGHIVGDPNVANTYKWHYARYEEWAKSRSQG